MSEQSSLSRCGYCRGIGGHYPGCMAMRVTGVASRLTGQCLCIREAEAVSTQAIDWLLVDGLPHVRGCPKALDLLDPASRVARKPVA